MEGLEGEGEGEEKGKEEGEGVEKKGRLCTEGYTISRWVLATRMILKPGHLQGA